MPGREKYSAFQLGLKYLGYCLSSSNGRGHGTHSPFIFDFITHVLNDPTQYEAYKRVEELRKDLLKDKTILEVKDFGAGSVSNKSFRTVSSIAANAAKPKKFGQLLYRLVKHYQPRNIVELGTSLGITTSYLSLANNQAEIFTLEGSAEVSRIAGRNMDRMGAGNVKQVPGNFDDTLEPLLSQLGKIDFAFVDGNHRLEPTLDYFRLFLNHIHNDSILVFDDIHWSPGMEKAWKIIQEDQMVRCSVDLFFIGVVFFRQEFKEKQHFQIRY